MTPTSYVVLGLLEAAEEATPYELKAMVAAGVGHLWSLQHAQVYSEPERLTAAGLLEERREEGGRRRKRYRLTAAGQEALDRWRAEPTDALTELRDLGLLQLYFGADPGPLAERQLAVHRTQLERYQQMARDNEAVMPRGVRLSLEAGIGHEREWIGFWERVAAQG